MFLKFKLKRYRSHSESLIFSSCTNLFPLFVPCKDPAAFATGDGVAGDSDDIAYVRDTHRLQRFALGIADVIERMTLRHEEVTAPPFQLSHAAARQATDTLALLVIDIVPVLRLLDIRNLLAKSSCSYCQQKK